MKSRSLRAFLALLAGAAALFATTAHAADGGKVVRAIEFANDVNPVTADYVKGAIDDAEDEATAVVILLDTPGGLGSSMDEIVKAELDSKIPVIVYVSPAGANSASAGVFIAQAADVLAMAPQTSIGASTPIGQGGGNLPSDERRKAINFYAAKLRGLAKSHGRSGAWAEKAVRKASSLSADEAVAQHVADVSAPTLPALLRKLDGFKTKPRGFTLHLADARIETVHMSWWKRILDTIIDPNIIVLLMSIGTLGIVVELWAPGHIFPGTVGAVSLILALFGLSVLPVSWAGILLMILALAFFGAEPFVTSHGALAVAGAVCFVFGSLLLFDPAGQAYEVSLPVVIAIAAVLCGFLLFIVAKLVQIRRKPVEVGVHSLVGARGRVRRDGFVLVAGELWRVRSEDDEQLAPGELVEVVHVDGLSVTVRPAREEAPASQPTA